MTESQLNEEELILTDDINKILAKKLKTTEFNIVSYKLEPFDEKIGLLGDHANLKVVVVNLSKKEEREFYFFVKFFPFVDVSAVFARETGAFAKEIFTNEILFSKIKNYGIEIIKQCVGECYLTEAERLLVFDDLTKQGYETLDKRKDFNFDMILIVLKSLAKLHASSLIYEEKRSEELGREYRLIEDYRNEFEETFYNDREGFINLQGVEASIKAIFTEIDLFKHPSKLKSGKDFKSVAEKCCYKIYEMVKPSNKYRNVISHGDLWSTNLLMKFNQHRTPVECKFVDFQMTRYAPPSHDVVSVLYLTTSREFRKQHMYELLGLYYTALESNLKLAGYDLKALIPFGDFLQNCEEQKAFALAQTATYFQLVLVESDALKEFYANPTLSRHTFFEDRSPLVLAYVNKDEYYRKKLEESIEDLKDYCERL
ncbi:hypothetical protein ILUMI_26320 [Ignelater luminosus]|uniref:CHK kinase-like domain-containing protein n=1 Tax=Ignelater luminosus TaxID=2038154 RepID=A0A8K0C4F9_IGNLU|nr:hypothetical protein ILUMI_26320 [Ignelater luminosus]